ncbi:MAG: glycosyltransferase family 87 protein [Polyangiales bacterium]
MSAEKPRQTTLLLSWSIAAGALLVYAIERAPVGARAWPYIALHTGMALAQLALAWRLARSNIDPRIRDGVLWAAIAARVALVFVSSFTTTDVSRYVWDGAVVLSGHDPFALAPDAGELASLRARWPLPEDHHDVVGCYPPLAEALFAVCALAGPALATLAWKSLVALVSALSARSLWRACETPAQRALATLWLFHPLVLFEGGVGAHLDVLTGACVLWALLAMERDAHDRAALFLGAAVALKITPLILCAALWPRARARVRWALLCAVIPAVTIGAPVAMGAAFPGSLPLVAQHWSFGAPLWSALYARWPTSDSMIRPALALAGALWVFAQWLRPRASHSEIARDALLGYALTNPTLYPWYLLPALAAGSLARARNGGAVLWALVTITPFSYEVIDRYALRRLWSPARWPLYLTALAPLVAVLVAWVIDRDRSEKNQST